MSFLYKLLDMAEVLEQSELITIEQYNQELDEAEAEFEKGEVVTHEEAVKQIREWERNNFGREGAIFKSSIGPVVRISPITFANFRVTGILFCSISC